MWELGNRQFNSGKWPREIPELCCRPQEYLILAGAEGSKKEATRENERSAYPGHLFAYVENNTGRNLNLCSNVTFSITPTLIILFSLTTHACICISNSPYVALFSTWYLSPILLKYYIFYIFYVYYLSPN